MVLQPTFGHRPDYGPQPTSCASSPDRYTNSADTINGNNRTMHRRLSDLIIGGLLFLLPLILFWPQTIGGKTLIPTENLYQYEPYATYADQVGAPETPHNHLLSDLVLQNYQWKSFIRQNIDQGEIPLWNPHQFSGIPFMAAGQQSTLYPPSVLYYVLPLTSAYGWFTVVNLWLAGLFMYAFMRGLGVTRAGATIAAITYELCGFFIASAVFPMILGAVVWLPLLLLMAEFIIVRRPLLGRESRAPWVAIGAGGLGCSILAGHVEITIYTLLILAYYSAGRLVWLWWRARHSPTDSPPDNIQTEPPQVIQSAPSEILKSASWLAIMVVLGFGLAAIQFIPLFEVADANWRAERTSIDTVLGYAHPLRDLAQFVLPNFYGSPAHHSYFDVFSGETVPVTVNALGESIYHTDWGIKNYVEGALYLGILPLVLAMFGLFDTFWIQRKAHHALPLRARYIIFALLGLISLSFMFGLPSYRLIYPLPGINQLNSPFRWIFGVAISVAVLAGFGADALGRITDKFVGRRDKREGAALLKRPSPTEKETDKSQTARWARRFALGLVILGALILAGLLFSRVFFDQVEPLIQRVLDNMAKANQAFADAEMFYSYQFKNVLILGLMVLGSGVVFWAATHNWVIRKNSKAPHRVWVMLAILVTAVDLMIASWRFNPASDPDLLDFTPPAIQYLLDQETEDGPFRYTTLDAPGHDQLLWPNMTMRYGLDDIRGYDSIISAQYVDYMRDTAPQLQLDHNRISPLYLDRIEEIDFRRLNLLNVRYLVTHKSITLPENLTTPIGRDPAPYRQVFEDNVVRIWRSSYADDRAFVIYNDSDAEDLRIDQIPYISYRGDSWARGDATITSDSGREKFIDTRHDQAGWLFVSETYAPGWRAYIRPLGVDEEEEEQIAVHRVLDNLQGVDLRDVPAGHYTIRIVYSPTSFQVGLFGSIISTALIVFLFGVWLWRMMVGGSDDQGSTVSRVARNSVAPIILNLFNRGIDMAFAFVMLRILGPEDAGIYFYATVVFVWFDIFTNFGLDVLLIREASRTRDRARHLFLNTNYFRIFMMFACVPLVVGFLFLRQSLIADPLPGRGLLAIGLLYIGLAPGSINKGITSLFYAFEQAEYPAAVATISTMNKAVFGLIALLLGYGIVGLAAVSIITNVITLVILLWQGRKLIARPGEQDRATPRFNPDRSLIRGMAAESWPLMLNHFLATIFFQIDIVLLEALKGAVIVGKYSTAYKWLLAVNVIPAFFTQALLPVMSRQANEDREALKRTYSLGIKLLVSVAMPMAVAFSFMAHSLTLALGGSEFLPEGAIALQIMIWSIPIGWMNSLTQYALIAVDLQRKITRAFIIAVAFNIITNLIFIPQYGYQAAAVTTIFSEMVLLIPFAVLLTGALGRLAWIDMVWRAGVAGGFMAAIMSLGWPIAPVLAVVVAPVVYLAVWIALKPLNAAERAMLFPLLPGRLKAIARAT